MLPAATAALGAWAAHEQGQFWEYHDQLHAKGPRFTSMDLELVAMRLGLDVDKWYADADSEKAKKDIREDVDLAQGLGITGTPTYFINGRPLDGAHPELDFRLLFAEEFERADKALADGVAPEKLYEHLAGIED